MGAAGEISLSSKLGQDPAQFLPTLPSQSWDVTLSLSWSDPDSQLKAEQNIYLGLPAQDFLAKTPGSWGLCAPPAAPGRFHISTFGRAGGRGGENIKKRSSVKNVYGVMGKARRISLAGPCLGRNLRVVGSWPGKQSSDAGEAPFHNHFSPPGLACRFMGPSPVPIPRAPTHPGSHHSGLPQYWPPN